MTIKVSLRLFSVAIVFCFLMLSIILFGVFSAHNRFILALVLSLIALSGMFFACICVMRMEMRQIETRREKDPSENNHSRSLQILNSVAEAIMAIDCEGNCTFANAACLELLGYENMEMLLGKNMHQMIHHSHDDGKPMPVEECRIYQTYIKGRKIYVEDEVVWKADGSCISVECWSNPQMDKDGKVTGAVLTFIGVNTLKNPENYLQSNRNFLSRVIDHCPSIISIRDTESRYHLVNRKWEEEIGVKRADALGKTVDEVNRGSIGAYLREIDRKAMAEGTYWEGEETLNSPNGKRHYLAIRFPLKDDDSNIVGICGIMTNITRGKHIEAKLAYEQQRLAYILEATNVGTWEWNVRTGEINLNERWAELAGYTLAELTRPTMDSLSVMIHPEDRKESAQLRERHLRGESPYYECEMRIRHKDGNWIWVLDRGKVVSWTNEGKPLLMCGTHQNITQRKTVEEKIQYMERIFLHDIMNTAVALRGYSAVIRCGGIDVPTERMFIKNIVLLSSQIIDEINGHRLLMAAEQKNLVITRAAINSLTFLNDLFSIYSIAEMLDNRLLKLDPAAQNVIFMSDRTLLNRIVGNMVKNAIEASSPGDTITLGCHQKEDQIRFWVHNPAHIPEEVQKHIFGRSFSTKGTGRGLGTYSMKFLSEQYLHGRVFFISTQNEGTTFTAEFPIA